MLVLPLAHPSPGGVERGLGRVVDASRRELGAHALGVGEGRGALGLGGVGRRGGDLPRRVGDAHGLLLDPHRVASPRELRLERRGHGAAGGEHGFEIVRQQDVTRRGRRPRAPRRPERGALVPRRAPAARVRARSTRRRWAAACEARPRAPRGPCAQVRPGEARRLPTSPAGA